VGGGGGGVVVGLGGVGVLLILHGVKDEEGKECSEQGAAMGGGVGFIHAGGSPGAEFKKDKTPGGGNKGEVRSRKEFR